MRSNSNLVQLVGYVGDMRRHMANRLVLFMTCMMVCVKRMINGFVCLSTCFILDLPMSVPILYIIRGGRGLSEIGRYKFYVNNLLKKQSPFLYQYDSPLYKIHSHAHISILSSLKKNRMPTYQGVS